MLKFEQANEKIAIYLRKYKKTVFFDVYHHMLKSNGTPMPDIFLVDNLHMNAKGYAIWQKLIAAHLLKD